MKKLYTVVAALMVAAAGYAQTDSTKNNVDTTISRVDTIKVGNFIIIKKRRTRTSDNTEKTGDNTEVTIERTPKKPSKISTNWWIFDLGFANLNDKTNYADADAQAFLRSVSKEDLKLRAIKSSNVNIWVVMQRISLIKGYLNLKYGAGFEMFNFRYESNISYHKKPAYIFKDTVSFSKNKLYASYLSVPFMLNLNTTPGRKKGLSISAGVSAGYLIESRNKQISGERGKVKTKGDLGLNQFRVAYIGELGIGSVRLFGSYSMKTLHEKGLQQYPYSMGIRFSNF
ncbi:MAG TPA: outer membrane beta-barrel protein [Segetibacter sp.]